ncbi:MAG: PepSY-associated TM helix domain-containing protein [Pseudomonadota bacterium]
MLKTVLLRLHAWLGISAGLVIAVVGSTGAMMAFEPQILRLINPGILQIEASAGQAMLSPQALYRQIQLAAPERPVQALTLSGAPDRPAHIVFTSAKNPKGDAAWVQPYTGALLPEPRGEEAFEWIEDVHRKLLAGEVGKAVTGFSAFALIFMSFSGLYLRWKRRPRGVQGWLGYRRDLQGRAWHFQLHSVAGTWLFALFLFSAGTGLSWSYGWYKESVYRLLAVEMPKKPKPGPQVLVSVAQFEQQLAPVWPRLQAELPVYDSATVLFGSLGSDAIKVEYLAKDAPHIRAKNTITFSPSGELLSHKRFTEKPWGEQITTSWKMLHTGQYWGWSGQLMMMLSSLSLLGFAWLGLQMFRSRTTPR